MSSLKCVGVFVASIFVGTAAMAAPTPRVIHACYNKSNGLVHIVNASSDCSPREQAVSWNEEGPAGTTGIFGLNSLSFNMGSGGTGVVRSAVSF
jgi:hypothetical protein